MDTATTVTPEVAFLDVDEGYEWVGGATLSLTAEWQHIAMDYVYTLPSHKGHEIQIAFLIGASEATFFFDDIQVSAKETVDPHTKEMATPNPNLADLCLGRFSQPENSDSSIQSRPP